MKKLTQSLIFSFFFLSSSVQLQALASEPPAEIPSVDDDGTQAPASDEEQHICEGRDEYRSKQCCYRAERIKQLQESEFSLESENGRSLFDLQKDYDKKLAELKIYEGVLALQEDYIEFSQRLENPEESSSRLSKLASLQRLEEDSREVIDRAYRLQFIHEAMEEIESRTGPFSGNADPEQLYDQASQNCQETNNVEGVCRLLNPQSEFNQTASASANIAREDMHEMMKNYLTAYGVSTEGLTPEQKQERHAEFERSLERVPSSVLTRQITAYEEKQEEINEYFSQTSNQELGQFYNCIKRARYKAIGEGCTANMANDRLQTSLDEISRRVSAQAHEVIDAGFSDILSNEQMAIIKNGLDRQTESVPAEMREQHDRTESLTEEESDSFQEVFDEVNNKLQLAADISKRRGRDAQEEFLSEFVESDNDEEVASMQKKLMNRLCNNNDDDENNNEQPEFSRNGLYECLKGTKTANINDIKNRKMPALRSELENLQAQIDEITSSDPYKRINSFKNYYAHESRERCGTSSDEEGALSYSGSCYSSFDSDENPVIRLTDDTQKVIAEVEYRQNGGPSRGIEELSAMHEFCYELEESERGPFENECSQIQLNYQEATTDYSQLSPEYEEYIQENMAVYDPETGEVSYEKRQSGWGVLGISSARAVASSVPNFMQYQHTKSMLPFMRDQAMFQKTQQHFYNQQFMANFFRPGGFNSFGSGGFNYGVSPFGNIPNYGSRVPIGSPQGLNIP